VIVFVDKEWKRIKNTIETKEKRKTKRKKYKKT
jgi:hypothetical protein